MGTASQYSGRLAEHINRLTILVLIKLNPGGLSDLSSCHFYQRKLPWFSSSVKPGFHPIPEKMCRNIQDIT